MRKLKRNLLLVSILSIIVVVNIIFLPGCGGGSGGSGKINRNQIKVYETSGGFAFMPENINKSGIVFADGFNEISDEYILYVLNSTDNSVISSIEAIAYDEQGNIKNSPIIPTIIPTKNPSDSNCFSLDNINAINGKISANIIANAPGGCCELKLVCDTLSRTVKVWVYNGIGSMPRGDGYKIDNIGSGKHRCIIEEECSIYERASTDGCTKTILKGNAYPIDSNKNEYWGTRLKAVKNINEALSTDTDWLLDQELEEGIIYLVKDNFGGYMKIVRIGSIKIWEYSDNGEFN